MRRMEGNRRRQQEARRLQQARALPPDRRHELYSSLLEQLSLSPCHREALRRRGLSDAAIARWGFASVSLGHRLRTPLPDSLPGLRPGGFALNSLPGLLIAIRDPHERILGFQVRLDSIADGGKYRWLSSRCRDNPHAPPLALPNGENPITACIATSGDPAVVNLAEGFLKPLIASERWQQSFLGAAGGLFPSSASLLREYLAALAPKQVCLWGDGGAVCNSGVLSSYKKTLDVVGSWGYEVKVAWWGQYDKSHGDCDEIPPSTSIEFLSPARYWRIVRDHNLPNLAEYAHWLGISPDTSGHPSELPRRAESYRIRALQSRLRSRIFAAMRRRGLDWESPEVSRFLQDRKAKNLMGLTLSGLKEMQAHLED